ncbi:hypothetical protein AGMMS49587_02440 [Spirochaetia bacterium]|nr:hypothetical protein AGMMS49587_02440 [Spirochaetia bacterium]
MPWRLIGFILIFALLVVFIAFNLDNKSDISFGFAKIEQAPVYLTAFSSFALGMILAVPFVISLRLKRKAPRGEADAPSPRRWGKGKKKDDSGEAEEILGEASNGVPRGGGGPYGIN